MSTTAHKGNMRNVCGWSCESVPWCQSNPNASATLPGCKPAGRVGVVSG